MRTMLPSDRKAEKRKIIEANSRFIESLKKNDYIGCRNEILAMKQSVEALNISAYWAYTHGNFKLSKLAFKDAVNFSNHITTCWVKLTDRMLDFIDNIWRIDLWWAIHFQRGEEYGN